MLLLVKQQITHHFSVTEISEIMRKQMIASKIPENYQIPENKKTSYQFISIHFNSNPILTLRYQFLLSKSRNQPSIFSDFQFQPFCYTAVNFQGHTQQWSQIFVLEPRSPLKKIFFLSQILTKLKLQLLLQKCQSYQTLFT